MPSPAVSVIMPFHNAETTIETALKSLVGQQSGDSVEFVLVNDGSTDRSMEIVNYLLALHPEFDKNTRVVSYPFRQGAAYAMAQGMKNARGEYLARLDSDDSFEPDAIASMLALAVDEGADIVCADMFVNVVGHRQRVRRMVREAGDLNRMPVDVYHFSLGTKLLRRSMLESHGIAPVSGVDSWDDISITARAFALSGRTVHLRKPVYHYNIDRSKCSLSRCRPELMLRQRLVCALLLEKWFEDEGLSDTYAPFLRLLKFTARMKYLRGRECDVRKWRETFPEVNTRIMSMTPLRLPLRLGMALAVRLPVPLTRFCCRVLDRFWR